MIDIKFDSHSWYTLDTIPSPPDNQAESSYERELDQISTVSYFLSSFTFSLVLASLLSHHRPCVFHHFSSSFPFFVLSHDRDNRENFPNDVPRGSKKFSYLFNKILLFSENYLYIYVNVYTFMLIFIYLCLYLFNKIFPIF